MADSSIATIIYPIISAIGTHVLIHEFPKLKNKLSEFLDKNNILKKAQQAENPPKQVIINTVESLLKTDDSDLQYMYLKLLKTSYDKDKQNLSHPSFPLLIDQLTRDEAFMLYELQCGEKRLRDSYLYDKDYRNFLPPTEIFNEFNRSSLFFPANWGMYTMHLTHLNLIDHYEDNARRKPLERVVDDAKPPHVKTYWHNDDPNQTLYYQHGVEQEYVYQLTDFGKLFAEACIPSDIEREAFDYLSKYQPKGN